MPELPEVETTRRGLAPHVEGERITGAVVRHHRLRWPVPRRLAAKVAGRRVAALRRRAKYLLFDLGDATLIVHLGMSGSLRIARADEPPGPYDHFDLRLGEKIVRLRDPRRFGAVLWQAGTPDAHPLIAGLGVEPLGPGFTPEFLFTASRGRKVAVKQFLMNAAIVVGVGNIYASESLFRARVNPRLAAGRLSRAACARLHAAVRETLDRAIEAGGSTLRDFVGSDGEPGYFQQEYFVYDRAGEPCRVCGAPVRRIVQGARSTYYCPHCQR
ncbi:MAG: bifunctional DNA-formamidopyrimidine glycosylase/DNA-(apurinic or apyrimidinic site) lyase [Burkholderiales bacterium]|jgi:formamidopyrimidine-DNA glycosylase|nr:bifunctional DNA-formamidopyrimidine glycosylase/DNA-(apurinic or apyrimidinic site) lyase [Burkholderiales bacterium]